MADEILRNLPELLAAFGVPDVAGLGVVLSQDTDTDVWVDDSNGSIALACGTFGLEVSFPTTAEDVKSMVAELELEYTWSVAVDGIGEMIEAEEGFGVEVAGPAIEREPGPHGWPSPGQVDTYPFHVPAPGDWTLGYWQRARFGVAYPGLEATVRRRDGSPASSQDRLSDLREPEGEAPMAETGRGPGRRPVPGPPDARDVLVVNIGRALLKGMGTMEASRGDWRVAPRSVQHLRFVVAVAPGSQVQGVFEVFGYEEVAQPDGSVRLRFDLETTDLQVEVDLPKMYGALYFDRSARLFGAADEAGDAGSRETSSGATESTGVERTGAEQLGPAADPDQPPDWLRPLLDRDRHVALPTPVAAVRRHVPRTGHPPARLRSPDDSPDPVTHFAVVDDSDSNRVISFHALTAPQATQERGDWWTFHDGVWLRDARPAGALGGPLRWIRPSLTPSVLAQFRGLAEARRRPPSRLSDAALRSRLEAALRDQVSGSVDLGPGYVQWAGYPAGLHLEVGDGRDYAVGLDEDLWRRLRWIGWNPPSGDNRNAWYESEGPDTIDAALDLVARTLDVLDTARQPATAPEPPTRDAQPAAPVGFPPDFVPPPEFNPNPDLVDPREPHYFDCLGDSRDCLFCDGAPQDRIHLPFVAVIAPRWSVDHLDDARAEAADWYHGYHPGFPVLIDLLDALPHLRSLHVRDADDLITQLGPRGAAAELRRRSADSTLRIGLTVDEQADGVLEGIPRPFGRDSAAGYRLAALVHELAAAGTPVLVCTLWVVSEDAFHAGLSGPSTVRWLRSPCPHAFAPDPVDRSRCLACGAEDYSEIHFWG